MRRLNCWKRGESAFSMVELLVVITILAALAAGSTIWFRVAEANKLKLLTRTRLTAIGAGLDVLKQDIGYYPPTDTLALVAPDRKKIGETIGRPNDTNVGIETVYVAFHMTGVSVNTDSLGDDSIDNTDDDAANELAGTTLTSNELFEYVDAYGTPFFYFHSRDFKDASKFEKYVRRQGDDGVELLAAPETSEKTGAFVRAQSFQLFSAGPDRDPTTWDDNIQWGAE